MTSVSLFPTLRLLNDNLTSFPPLPTASSLLAQARVLAQEEVTDALDALREAVQRLEQVLSTNLASPGVLAEADQLRKRIISGANNMQSIAERTVR